MGDFREALIEIKDDLIKDDIESHKRNYPKKSFEELIDCLDQKGIKFNITTKDDAFHILHDINYYYKLTVYKRNFKKNKDGKFIDLEFSYLTDLASVDMQLRYLLLQATLDIEHSLKTFLVTKITENEEEDGYDIVRRFFHSTAYSKKVLTKDSILESVKNKSHYQYKLYETHKAAPSSWVLMEVISFGDFLRFFEFYFKSYSASSEFNINSLMGVLNSVKRIRNACAHNNAFLFDLANSDIKRVSGYLKEYAKNLGIGELFYKCNKVHDVLCVFYIHEKFIKGKGSREHRIESFRALTTKSINRFSYINKDNDILYFFKILKNILDKYEI